MKIVGKIIKWTILACIAAFLLTWWGAMLKNYILTVKYKDVMKILVMIQRIVENILKVR